MESIGVGERRAENHIPQFRSQLAQKINITTGNETSAKAASSSSSGGDVAAVEASSDAAAAVASSSKDSHSAATVADGKAAVAGMAAKGDKDLALLPGTAMSALCFYLTSLVCDHP